MGEKFKKGKKEFSSNRVLKKLGDNTRKVLEENRAKIKDSTTVSSVTGRIGFTRDNPKHLSYFKHGCDLLQYEIVVKPYIMKKYKIKTQIELSALLYLYPIQFFTKKDYDLLPVAIHHLYLKTMIDLGHIKIAVKGTAADVYTLSDSSVRIVQDYYAYLSGDKVIAPNHYTNPFRGVEAKKVDKVRERLMMRLRDQSEKKPSMFRRGLSSKGL